MKLYGHFFSSPANLMRLTASATGLKHEYSHVDLMKGEQSTPEFLKINPAGKVPVLVDGDFMLSESGAIIRYIANTQKSDLYPADIKARAIVDQWIDFSSHSTRAAVGKVLFNKFFAPMMNIDIDERSLKEGGEMLSAQLPIVEEKLQQSPYLCGDAMSLGDIAMIAAMEPFEMIGVSLESFPAITKWRQGIMAQEFYQNVHSHFGAESQ